MRKRNEEFNNDKVGRKLLIYVPLFLFTACTSNSCKIVPTRQDKISGTSNG